MVPQSICPSPLEFLRLLMLFLGFATAYTRHQDRLMLREGLLVAFFLCGLVALGGQQTWWLQPLLSGTSPDAVLVGATALTAVTDNAALTYLGSLVPTSAAIPIRVMRANPYGAAASIPLSSRSAWSYQYDQQPTPSNRPAESVQTNGAGARRLHEHA